MKASCLLLFLFGACTINARAAGTVYTLNYNNSVTWDLDWTDSTKYSPSSGYPQVAGDHLEVTVGNSGNYAPNNFNMNGDKTIGLFKKIIPYGKNTAIQPGSVAASVLTWDTGDPAVDAVFDVYGSGGSTNNGDLRCATFVHMNLQSNLQWKGSSTRDYATNNGRLSGNISGPGKLNVWWNSNRSKVTSSGRHMGIIGGTTGNTHVGGTEFKYYAKAYVTGNLANRSGFLLAKEQATGLGNTTVDGNAEIYIDTNIGTQGAIHDTTSINLLSGATIELATGVSETVSGLYFDGVLQAAGTWGSSLSAADNKSDTWFKGTGTGVLNVVYVQELAVEQPSGAQVVDDVTNANIGSTAPATSMVKTFTVRNIGTATLTLTSLTMDGADTADFTLGSLGALLLAPGESTTFDLTFHPATLGAKTVAIHLGSDDRDEAAFDFNVTATGAYPPTYIWQGSEGGSWNIAGNWNNTLPGIGLVAVFSDVIGGATVDIDSPSATAGGLLFNNNIANQAIGSAGSFPLILNNNAAIAPVTVTGSHTVSAAMQAARGIAVTTPGPSGTLTLSGTSTAVGSGASANAVVMDIYGAGTEVILSGSMTLTNSRSTHVTGNGKLTITGTYATNGSAQIIGSTDHGGGTGDVVLGGTGTWTHSGAGSLLVGNNGVSNVGTLTINGDAVLIAGTESIVIGAGTAAYSSAGIVTQNGGRVTNASTWGTSLGTGTDPSGNSTATYHLNGGVHETLQIWGDSVGHNVFNFNGGTLRALSATYPTDFITGLTHAYVQDNGAIIDTNGFDVAADQALEHGTGAAIDGGLTKKGGGILTLTKSNNYTGNTTIEDGVLKVDVPNFADTSTLTIGKVADSSAMLNLPNAGTDTVAALVIDGVAKGPGLYDSGNSDGAITGEGKIQVGGSVASAYDVWISGPAGYFPGETNPAIIGADADPDGDGQSNFLEFALGGVPNNPADGPKVFSLAADSSADGDSTSELLLTIAVRSGTPAFTGSPSPSASHDGATYVIEGSINLTNFSLVVTPVVPVAPPAPNATPPAGYEYRTFSLDGSNGLPAGGFLRVGVAH